MITLELTDEGFFFCLKSESLLLDLGFNFRYISRFARVITNINFHFYVDISNFLDLKNAPERSCIVSEIISKLNKILHWFTRQKRVKFYSSSILIAFDGEKTHYIDDIVSSEKSSTCEGSDFSHRGNDVTQKTIDVKHKQNDAKHQGKGITTSKGDVVVRMIDFPHTYIDLNGEKSLDTNYIYGLRNLIQIFEHLNSLLI